MPGRIRADMMIQDVLDHWPGVVQVFFRRRMACVGCVMAPFETLEEAADVYGIDRDQLMSELRRASLSAV